MFVALAPPWEEGAPVRRAGRVALTAVVANLPWLVPALLVYWACSGAWTLAQSAVITRWFPTPGTPAAARAALRAG